MLLLGFATKVWQRLESRWVERIAEWIDAKVLTFAPGYGKRYRQYLLYRHRNFDVKGLTTQNVYTLELEQVFVDLTIAPRPPHLTSADPIRPLPEELRGEHPIWHYLSAETLAGQHLAIIGAPGSGKTTLLKHITLTLATRRKNRTQIGTPNKLPVLLFLRNHANAIAETPEYTLVDALHASVQSAQGPQPPPGWFAHQLKAERCLVLLDGLDEVADPTKRQKVVHWVEAQMMAYPANRFLVTSRPHGYQTNPLSGVTVMEVQPFSGAQVRHFVFN